MSDLKFDEELVTVFEDAARKAFTSLREKNEKFYYYTFIFDEGMQPYVSAWSEEAYERSLAENNIDEKDRNWWKWNYADSPYAVYGYDEFFGDVNALLKKRASMLSDEELYDLEWNIRILSMEEAMKRLNDDEFFGSGDDRKNVVINVEVAPPDGEDAARAKRLNPESTLLSLYLIYCE